MSEKIFDPIRSIFVKKTPEEIVRQSFVDYLISKKGFPKTSLTVEKSLQSLPFSSKVKGKIPLRRLDILCFDLQTGLPLLIVECKADSISLDMMKQVQGYNAFLKAPFTVLVGSKSLFFSYFNAKKGEYDYIEWMPHYNELKHSVYV